MCDFPGGALVKSPPSRDAVSTPIWEEKQLRPWAPTTEPALWSRELQELSPRVLQPRSTAREDTATTDEPAPQ